MSVTQDDQLPVTTRQDEANAMVIQRQELWNQAKAMADCSLVPAHFRGKPGDCFILADLCCRNGWPLLPTLQSTYVVHGKPGFEGKFVAALLDGSGKIVGPIDYEFEGDGDDYGCRAVVHDRALNKTVKGPKVDWKMVKAEGWNKNKGTEVSKWNTMPDVMFHYRAAAFLVRTRYPAVLMGMNTADELEDSVVRAVPQGAATMEDLTGGSAQKTEAAETADATEPAADSRPAVDTEPVAANEDDQPVESGTASKTAGAKGAPPTAVYPTLTAFTAAVHGALTLDAVDELVTDAEGLLTPGELGKLKATAANRRILLRSAARGRKGANG